MTTIDNNGVCELVRVVHDAMPGRFIEQIKTVRTITGFGLKEAKDLVDAERSRREPPCNPVLKALERIQEDRRHLANQKMFHRHPDDDSF